MAEPGTIIWTEAVGADLRILVEKLADCFNRNLNYIGIGQTGPDWCMSVLIDWAEEDCKGCAHAHKKGVAGCHYRSGFVEANRDHNR